ncbi:ThiF family adenylyltransferase [Pantoea sp. Mhis]|uniref:ThiF family adenylyltransferase n=1 Tax=Pantoea sp. Mhis TaxID=2576759 RepID=UPI0013574DAA|nr:ThiF family adenylyltransferase [Pantoea sp. Mhis]MXP56774.1 HesA/MoeB/ThiF family protein [Pantoea sp. Mhis]
MERYQRQIILPEIGHAGQQILKRANILVVGAGGLGATLLPQLAGSGIGYIRIYDNDNVTIHNLHRQTLFTMQDIGKPKVTCVKKNIKKINPNIKIDAIKKLLTPSSLKLALKNIDLAIDIADNFAITYPLSDICYIKKIPLISASVIGRQGYVGGFCNSAPSYHAVFPLIPNSIGNNCNNRGVMGPAVSVLGALQAQMALSVLLGLLPSPLGCIINCDFINWQFRQFRFDNAHEPNEPKISFVDLKLVSNRDYIIELRNHEEIQNNIIKNTKRILIKQLYTYPLPPKQRIILVCSSGIRAAQAANILIKRGFNNLAIIAANYI